MLPLENLDEHVFDYCFNIWNDECKVVSEFQRIEANKLFFYNDNPFYEEKKHSNEYIALFMPRETENEDEFILYKPYPAFSDHWTKTFMVGQYVTATNLAKAGNDQKKIMAAWLYGYLHNTYKMMRNDDLSSLYNDCRLNVDKHYSNFMKNVCFYNADMYNDYLYPSNALIDTLDDFIKCSANDYVTFCTDYKLLILKEKCEGYGEYVNLNHVNIWKEDKLSKKHIRKLSSDDFFQMFEK